MRRKFTNIFTVIILTTLAGVPAFAQEGELGEERQEIPVVERDSINTELSLEENRTDLGTPILITPKIPATTPAENQNKGKLAKPDSVSEKAKEEEAPSNLSFNFVYYLFYKFKVADVFND